MNVGPTFQADHCLTNGNVIESHIDHVYHNIPEDDNLVTKTLKNSSSDHLPVITTFSSKIARKNFKTKITKRKMKNFTKTNWNQALAKKNWSQIETCADLDEKVVIFTKLVTECLDEVAPLTEFTIRSMHKFGLSEETKSLMKKRDGARAMIRSASNNEKKIWTDKYKKLRNQVNSKVRQETVDYNNNRIDNAKNDNEVWNITKEITNPSSNSNWSMLIDQKVTEDPETIANAFNTFFIKKVEDIKENIDKALVKDPLEKLANQMKNNKAKFNLKPINLKDLNAIEAHSPHQLSHLQKIPLTSEK